METDNFEHLNAALSFLFDETLGEMKLKTASSVLGTVKKIVTESTPKNLFNAVYCLLF